MEGKGVGRVLGHEGGVAEELLLVELHERNDLLVEDVSCISLAVLSRWWCPMALRTCVLGLLSDLCEELDKVGQVIAEELGTNDQVLAGVGGLKSRAQELRLALYPQGRPPLGVLFITAISPEFRLRRSILSRISPTLNA